MFKLLFRLVIVFFLLAIAHSAFANGGTTTRAIKGAEIKDMRLWASPDATRIVFDLSAPVNYKVFTLDSPPRVVVDIQRAAMQFKTSEVLGLQQTSVQRVRAGVRNNTSVRLVLDMNTPLTGTPKSFLMKPNDIYGHRLVVDVPSKALTAPNVVAGNSGLNQPVSNSPAAKPTPKPVREKAAAVVVPPVESTRQPIAEPDAKPATKTITQPTTKPAPVTTSRRSPTSLPSERKREVVIAIDAGHGGEDPGAIGPNGTREKDVVLRLAKRIAGQINAEPGMRAVLIREGDYYVSLKKRGKIARRYQADLFMSIHADAFHQANVRGSSVYVLSQRGASSEAARWLAAKQNASDLVGGVKLADKDDELAEVLLDLSQTATMSASYDAAKLMLGQIGQVNKLHKRRVQDAGFVVLKSPDIPSMLIETAFLSNPREEKNLLSTKYQNRLARAVKNGVKQYFYQNPPADSLIASWTRKAGSRIHVISSGETLGGIAQRYGVSLSQLRSANGLASDSIRVGQRLNIPIVQASNR